MMTRRHGDEWIILHTEGTEYEVEERTSLPWQDSYCSRMVKGEGPRNAGDAQCVPPFRAALINQNLSIGAYIGIPVCLKDGSLFGTLCAIDPTPVANLSEESMEVIELSAKLLSSLLQYELEKNCTLTQQTSLAPRALKDSETELLNRQGWSLYLEKEDENIRAIGTKAQILAIEIPIDDINRCRELNSMKYIASALNSATQPNTVVARLGENIFMVLCLDHTTEEFDRMKTKITGNLADIEIEATMGDSMHDYRTSLAETVMSAIKNIV